MGKFTGRQRSLDLPLDWLAESKFGALEEKPFGPPSPEDGLRRGSLRSALRSERRLVEPWGVEPQTFSLRTRRSTN